MTKTTSKRRRAEMLPVSLQQQQQLQEVINDAHVSRAVLGTQSPPFMGQSVNRQAPAFVTVLTGFVIILGPS